LIVFLNCSSDSSFIIQYSFACSDTHVQATPALGFPPPLIPTYISTFHLCWSSNINKNAKELTFRQSSVNADALWQAFADTGIPWQPPPQKLHKANPLKQPIVPACYKPT
jgi:hypothetical protein